MTFFYNDIPSQDEYFKKHKIGWIRYIVINLKPKLNLSRLWYPEMWGKREKTVDTFSQFRYLCIFIVFI